MATPKTPLLAQERRNSEHSDQRAAEEDAALVGVQDQDATFLSKLKRVWNPRVREIILFLWALAASAGLIVLAVWVTHMEQVDRPRPPISTQAASSTSIKPGKRNLVFMVSDGMGPASLSLTRSFDQLVSGHPYNHALTLDKHFWGTSRTRSSSSLVTDSAAGATAFSCGRKTYNGAISMLPDFEPCGTVLEAAKRAGYLTGLVVTTDITDATPACFASHVYFRMQEDEIALQEVGIGHPLGRVVDLMMGGGRCHFLGNGTEGSCRGDDVDVAELAKRKEGWNYVDDRAGFDALQGGKNASLPLLGLFAPSDIPFEIDRRHLSHIYPSLSEMAAAALTALDEATKNSDKGFFLMIEGSRIDHAGHFNDPAAQVREVLEYDKTFGLVIDRLRESETEGVLLATSDHETGGLATAWQAPNELPVYNWYPEHLARANASAEFVTLLLQQHIMQNPSQDTEDLKEWINQHLVTKRLGISDALDVELNALASNPAGALYTFSGMVSLRARIGWSTHGHSAVDVNIYSSGGSEIVDRLRKNVENTDIGMALAEYLDVDTKEVTKLLKKAMKDQKRPDEADVQAATRPGWRWDGDVVPNDWMLNAQDAILFEQR